VKLENLVDVDQNSDHAVFICLAQPSPLSGANMAKITLERFRRRSRPVRLLTIVSAQRSGQGWADFFPVAASCATGLTPFQRRRSATHCAPALQGRSKSGALAKDQSTESKCEFPTVY
jgi:hypothetical protein